MPNITESLPLSAPVSAMDLLNHLPNPAVFYLPVWSEIESDKKIIDFQVGYVNKEAAATFHLYTGQLLSQLDDKLFAGKSVQRTVLFHTLQQALEGKSSNEQPYYDALTNRYYKLQCTKVKEGVLVIMNESTAEAPADLNGHPWYATAHGLLMLQAKRSESGIITDFILVKANQQLGQLLGWNEVPFGKSLSNALPQASTTFAQLSRVIESGIKYNYEYFHQGTQKNLLLAISRLDENNVVATFTDITETKQQKERQQQQFDERLQVVFDTARAGMYTLIPVRDEEGNITDFRFGIVNQAVASYLGLQAEDLAGSLGSLYFPAYKTNGLFDRYVETMNTGEPAIFDLHYADGYDNFFTINVVKMGDELFGTFTDHSPLKRLQRELEASIAELKRSNASLEQFAHAASHDLQEPLRKITLYTTKLEDQHAEELTDEAYGHLERIKTASKRMQRLIKDLLVFAEVGANRPEFEEISLNTLLQEVVNDLEVAIAESDAVITIGELGTIKGDGLHLQQLFQNLLSNSIKYSRPGVAPHITVTASQVSGKDTGLALSACEVGKDFWQIQLQDNGQGFTNEQAQQIFKIFQRLPQHRNEYTGTGIGLAIVQRVVENHKGYIKAEGIPGVGATFTILLPVNA